MKFQEAIKQLKKGKKVRRPSWDEGSYWKLGESDKICWVDGTTAHIHMHQIEAKDFEVFEIPKEKKFFCSICERFNCDCSSSHCYKIYDMKGMIKWVMENSELN